MKLKLLLLAGALTLVGCGGSEEVTGDGGGAPSAKSCKITGSNFGGTACDASGAAGDYSESQCNSAGAAWNQIRANGTTGMTCKAEWR